MKALLSAFLALIASQSAAQDEPVVGRMICEVTSSRYVAGEAGPAHSVMSAGQEYSKGDIFAFGYALDEDGALSIVLGSHGGRRMLVRDTLPATSFDGVSDLTNKAEYTDTYRSSSIGRHGFNYRGRDQLYLKKCPGDRWDGHYMQTNVSGLFTQVVSLKCMPDEGSLGDLIGRLAQLR